MMVHKWVLAALSALLWALLVVNLALEFSRGAPRPVEGVLASMLVRTDTVLVCGACFMMASMTVTIVLLALSEDEHD